MSVVHPHCWAVCTIILSRTELIRDCGIRAGHCRATVIQDVTAACARRAFSKRSLDDCDIDVVLAADETSPSQRDATDVDDGAMLMRGAEHAAIVIDMASDTARNAEPRRHPSRSLRVSGVCMATYNRPDCDFWATRVR